MFIIKCILLNGYLTAENLLNKEIQVFESWEEKEKNDLWFKMSKNGGSWVILNLCSNTLY